MLGPLVIRVGGGDVAVTGRRRQALLGMLLLRAGRAVPWEQLAEVVWEGRAPGTAREILPSYVMRLRRALGAEAGGRVVTAPGGYAVELEESELDLHRFRAGCRQARRQEDAGDWAGAYDAWEAALALWRGEVLAGLPAGGALRAELDAVAGARTEARRHRVEAGLRLGRHADVLAEVAVLAGSHPFDEHLQAQWVRALYRAGRQGEALRVYEDVRRRLAEELGVDPSPPLQELHRRILRADPALDAPVPAGPAGDAASAGGREGGGGAGAGAGHAGAAGRSAAPQQLPAVVRHFTGRAEELAVLGGLLEEAAAGGGAVVVSAIGGTAGVGKTTLAVHFAHQVAHRFPDGQLFVNLRGFDPGGEPTGTAAVVRAFLEALAVPAARVPKDLDGQLALYRSTLAGTRTLIVLDNARDAEQVRPLLPGTDSCLVLVTSRDRLSGLVALDGAVPLTLDVLSREEARELLCRRLGAGRVRAEQEAADELIALCAGLPLALNIAAARAVGRPGTALGVWARQLRAARTRLDVLSTGEPSSDVRAVLSWSYQALEPAAARLFRLLGLHPGPGVSAAAAAALAGVPLPEARDTLDRLARAHLITEQDDGRFTFHDLLRAYAAEQAERHDTGQARHEALARMFDHYLHTAYRAESLSHATDTAVTALDLPAAVPGSVPAALADHAQALAWFRAEQAVLTAAVARAHAAGFDDHAWLLAAVLVPFLLRAGAWREWEEVSRTALAAAVRSGHRDRQAHAHRWLGQVHRSEDRQPQAHAHLRLALDLFDALGDHARQGATLLDIALTHGEQKGFSEAVATSRTALDRLRAIGDTAGQALAFNSIGWYLAMLGDCAPALAHCHRALTLAREAATPRTEAAVLDSIGYIRHALGDFEDARTHYLEALRLRRSLGDYFLQSEALTHLGDTCLALGDTEAARTAWQDALTILDDLRHRDALAVRARLAGLGAGG